MSGNDDSAQLSTQNEQIIKDAQDVRHFIQDADTDDTENRRWIEMLTSLSVSNLHSSSLPNQLQKSFVVLGHPMPSFKIQSVMQ